MDSARTHTAAFAATVMAVGLLVAGCGQDDSSSAATTSSATNTTSATVSTSAAPTPAGTKDYASLLMKPEDIPPTPDGAFTADPPEVDLTTTPIDISRMYKSGPNLIQSAIVLQPDAAMAVQWLNSVAAHIPSQQTGTPVPAPSVTPDAIVVIGTSTDGKRAMTTLLFTVDNASAMVMFASPDVTTPAPQDFAESVGKVQVAAIQAALPGLK